MLKILLIESSDELKQELDKISTQQISYEIVQQMNTLNSITTVINNDEVDCIIVELKCCPNIWEQIKVCKKIRPFVEFIIVAEQEQRNEAYLAIQHRVLNFLLKPSYLDQLQEELLELYRRKQFSQKVREDQKKLRLYELTQHQKWMEKILKHMIDKPEELDFLLGEINQRYSTEMRKDCFQGIVVSTTRPELYHPQLKFVQEVISLMEESFSFSHEVIGAVIHPYGITGVLNLSFMDRLERNIYAVNQFFEQITQLDQKYGEFQFVIAIGTVKNQMSEVNESLAEALRVEKYKLVDYDQRIYFASKLKDEELMISDIVDLQQQKGLESILATMDEKGFQIWMGRVSKEIQNKFFYRPQALILVKDFLLQLCEKEYGKEKQRKIVDSEEVKALEYLFSGNQLLQQMEQLILQIIKQRKETFTNNYSKPIKEAIRYMNSHFTTGVSQEETANKCGLSTNYFSRCFKQETGMNYIDYIVMLRLEMAEKLLLTTVFSVKEVAKQVGYMDEKYFLTLFKQRFNVTPGKYRTTMKTNMNKNHEIERGI